MSATKIIDEISKYFGIKDLKKRLKAEMLDSKLKNHLGRPLQTKDSGLLISHFLQSSVAEASLLMFEKFCSENPEIKCYYTIHDAVIVDLPKHFCDSHPDGSNVDLFYNGWKFDSKLTYLDHN